MPNYSPKLPLTRGTETSYIMLKNMAEVIKQNFRMLVLTGPGERIMLADFGVGLHRFFFEPMTPVLFEKVRSRIGQQASTYMPFLTIRSISFITSEEDSDLRANSLYVKIKYAIPALNADDELQLTVNNYEF
jgi:phage baseplate assembly protein W|tara:strand:+ start:11073 stop:11468 length:396 start_codon:yes stop_codon:yes gene_type:complete